MSELTPEQSEHRARLVQLWETPLVRLLPSGEWGAVSRFAFTTGLLVGVDVWAYRTRFCYPLGIEAIKALAQWDGSGDPPGPWLKEKGRVERLNPHRCNCDQNISLCYRHNPYDGVEKNEAPK